MLIMKQEKIGGLPGKLLGLLGDQMSKLQHGTITVRQLELFLKKQNPFAEPVITMDVVKEVYAELGIDCEMPENVNVPEGDVWPVVAPKGMTPGKAFAIASKFFPTRKYADDLDKAVPEKVEETTIRFFQANIEADEEHEKKSAKQCEEEGIQGITFTERILMEIVYFKITGDHLDKDNFTLCAGSRDSYEDRVPRVGWGGDGDEFDIDHTLPHSADSFVRVRAVVSA